MKNIPLFKVQMPNGVPERLEKVLSSGYIAEGENVRNFENLLKKFLKNENIITTNSCTSALHLALKLCGVGAQDYVFSTPMTCVATNVSVQNLGAKCVWIDSDSINGMMSPEKLKETLEFYVKSNYPMPKAVIYVCWGGDTGPLSKINSICRQYKIRLIIDAAQAFGAGSQSPAILGSGVQGDFVCFSFQAIKHVTTGDGGALACRYPEDCKRAFRLKWFGIDRDGFRTPNGEIDWDADISEIGFKFHMNNIAGCIGEAQLEDPNFETRLNTYQKNAVRLEKLLETDLPAHIIERSWKGSTAAWVATFNTFRPIQLLNYLKTKGIHASQMHVNNDIYSGFTGAMPSDLLKGVKTFMATHICLPCGPWVSNEDLQYIVDCIKEFYE